MMKRFAVIAALFAVISVSPVHASQPAAAANGTAAFPAAVMAVVDLERIMKESTAGKSVREQLDSRRTTYQQQVAADERKLRDAEQALIKERATLNAEQFDTKRREFETQARAAQQRVQERARALDAAFSEALGTIKQNVAQIVAELAKARSVNVVVDKSQVIVVESSLDLTTAVLEQLNRKLARVEVRVQEGRAAQSATRR